MMNTDNDFELSNLLDPGCYDHPVDVVELIETHISWVLLAGDYAYKIKKPVDFGFLDFSTLDKRHKYCQLELELNRRLAPQLYLDVVAITQQSEGLSVFQPGDAIEYAVKMLRFPGDQQLDRLLKAGELNIDRMDSIAAMVAGFHALIAVASDDSEYGGVQTVLNPALENIEVIRQTLDSGTLSGITDRLDSIESWTRQRYQQLASDFASRKQDGYVRECHGDMHLGNMLWYHEEPLAFDCIEFNPTLRWIDVISEVAFLCMDLEDRKQQRLSHRFLNRYLEHTGDYAALRLLRFYLCYRALVRAKVDALRLVQAGQDTADIEAEREEFASYLELAETYTQVRQPLLILMRGMSASGKSTIALGLADIIGAIRLRSDVERKRLFGIAPHEDAGSRPEQGIYTSQASQQTYDRLVELAGTILAAGYSVIIDAANLRREDRDRFAALAREHDVPYRLVDITAPDDVLRERIVSRPREVSDAGLDVLEQQMKNWQALDAEEAGHCVCVDSTEPVDTEALATALFDQGS